MMRHIILTVAAMLVLSSTMASAMCMGCENMSGNAPAMERSMDDMMMDCHDEDGSAGAMDMMDGCADYGCTTVSQMTKPQDDHVRLSTKLSHEPAFAVAYHSFNPDQLKEPPKA